MEPPVLSDLLDLQELDLDIDRLRHRRQAMPELAAYRQKHEEAESIRAELNNKRAELHQLDLQEDKAEGELQLLELKLHEHENRLYAGGMSGRETEYMRLEVQSLRGQREALEERALGMLDRLDPVRDEVKRLEERERASAAEEARLEGVIVAAWKEIDAQIARKEERKAEVAAPIPLDLRALYEDLRKSKEGVAIGRLEGGVCGGCHLALSKPEQAEAARSDPPRCIHCLRILVI
jgi:predicted  nucleic acid-binding Zn-ribbon protein